MINKKKERKEFVKMDWYSDCELLICDMTGEIYLFNVQTLKFSEEISGNLGVDYGVKTLAINTRLKKIIAGGINHDLVMFDLETFEKQTTFERHQTIHQTMFFKDFLVVEWHDNISIYTISGCNTKLEKTIQQQNLASFQMDENKMVLAFNLKNSKSSTVWVYTEMMDKKLSTSTPGNNPFIKMDELIQSMCFTDKIIVIGTRDGKLVLCDFGI